MVCHESTRQSVKVEPPVARLGPAPEILVISLDQPRAGRPTGEVILDDAERVTLTGWARRATSAQALALRAQIVLACAESGVSNKQIAVRLGCSAATVGKWRARFLTDRLEGLVDEDRPGRPSSVSLDRVRERTGHRAGHLQAPGQRAPGDRPRTGDDRALPVRTVRTQAVLRRQPRLAWRRPQHPLSRARALHPEERQAHDDRGRTRRGMRGHSRVLVADRTVEGRKTRGDRDRGNRPPHAGRQRDHGRVRRIPRLEPDRDRSRSLRTVERRRIRRGRWQGQRGLGPPGFPDRHRSVRHVVLQHLSQGSTLHRPAAAAGPGDVMGGAGEREHRSHRTAARQCRGLFRRQRHGLRVGDRWTRCRGHGGLSRRRVAERGSVGTGRVLPGHAGSVHVGGRRLLLVAGRAAPGGQRPARPGV